MSDRTPKTDFHNAVTTLCQEPIQVCQASPISFGHRIVSNSISVQIIADHDGMFHGAEKSPQISRYTLCRGLIRLCIGGEHLIGQQAVTLSSKKHRYDPPVPSKQASFVPVPGLQIPLPARAALWMRIRSNSSASHGGSMVAT